MTRCGGYDGVKALASVEEYDTTLGTWRSAPSLSEAAKPLSWRSIEHASHPRIHSSRCIVVFRG
eukprot:5383829-Amphidinium_carterae.1